MKKGGVSVPSFGLRCSASVVGKHKCSASASGMPARHRCEARACYAKQCAGLCGIELFPPEVIDPQHYPQRETDE
jgi:hypothetical protein